MLPLTAFFRGAGGLLPELLPGSSKRISSFFKMDFVPLSRAVAMFSHPPILHPLLSQARPRKQSGKHCRLLVSSLDPSLSKLLCHVPASLSQWPHASPHIQSLSKSSRFYCKCIPNPATCHPSPAVSGAHCLPLTSTTAVTSFWSPCSSPCPRQSVHTESPHPLKPTASSFKALRSSPLPLETYY